MRKYLPFFLFILVILATIFAFFSLLKIKAVDCPDCDNVLKSEVSKVKGKTLPDSLSYLNKMLGSNKNITAYSINLILPYNLKIDVIQRDAVLAFKLTNGKYALVDVAGNIKAEVPDTNLPKITSSVALTNDEVIFVSGLMKSLHTFYNVNEGKVSQDGLEIDNLEGKIIIFPLEGDKDILMGSLNLIISRLQGAKEASTIGTIDLRFKNPVLK